MASRGVVYKPRPHSSPCRQEFSPTLHAPPLHLERAPRTALVLRCTNRFQPLGNRFDFYNLLDNSTSVRICCYKLI